MYLNMLSVSGKKSSLVSFSLIHAAFSNKYFAIYQFFKFM